MGQNKKEREGWATKIAEYHDGDKGVFIQFEDCTHSPRPSIRIFMNTHANSAPIFYFLPLDVATVLLWDIFSDGAIVFTDADTGRRRGEPHWREIDIWSTSNAYVFKMLNKKGIEMEGSGIIRADTTDDGDVLEIAIPTFTARKMAYKVLSQVRDKL